MSKLKQILKSTPFYLFTTFNILLSLAMLYLISDVTDEHMPWGHGDLGWAFKGPWFYIGNCLMLAAFFGSVVYVSLKLRYKHLLWATLMSSSIIVYFILKHFFFFKEINL